MEIKFLPMTELLKLAGYHWSAYQYEENADSRYNPDASVDHRKTFYEIEKEIRQRYINNPDESIHCL